MLINRRFVAEEIGPSVEDQIHQAASKYYKEKADERIRSSLSRTYQDAYLRIYNSWKTHKRFIKNDKVESSIPSDQLIDKSIPSQVNDQVNGTEKCLICERNEESNIFNTAIQELQIRGADESMSIFVVCFTCGSRRQIN